MFEANKNRTISKNKIHLVLICDETGICNAFRIILEQLGGRGYILLSLIYSVPENQMNPMLEKEIKILEKRYSHTLYTCTLKVEVGKIDLIQEIIEAIINSNTDFKMQFLIFGNEEFVGLISGVLEYLNMDIFSIESNKN